MNSDDILRRAADAKRLLDEPLLVEAFTTVKAELTTAWENAPTRDTEGRERLYLMVRLLEKLRSHIRTVAEEGEIEAKRITQLDGERKFWLANLLGVE